MHCLDKTSVQLNPLEFGFENDGELLMPQKVKIFLPPNDELIPNCTCKKCARKTCVCFQNSLPCCKFCGCEDDKTCYNVYNNT